MAALLGSSICVSILIVILVAIYFINGHVLNGNKKILNDKIMTRPETITPQGAVRGVNMFTRRNRTVFGFMGIPFAQPPVGYLRFRAPLPASAWNGTLDASNGYNPCPQLEGGKVIGNEDCLYLNVYTPKLPANENSTLLPVIFFIVGGAYKTGSNTHTQFGPDFLLDKDVVLVVPNSRLEVLGYLSTGDDVSPGNYGIKDLVQALRWNQDYIQYYGGDPNQVTLFGTSSGATSTHLLTLSDSTDGLFHRYITNSGSALFADSDQSKEMYAELATELGEHLGCPTNKSTLLVECLRGFNFSQLVDTTSLFYKWKTTSSSVWIPTSEPNIEGALLIDTPRNLMAKRKIRDLPWMSSVVADEGLSFTIQFYEDPNLFEEFLDNIDSLLPLMLNYARSSKNVTSYTAALMSYYLNDLTADRNLLLKNLTELIGDTLFTYPLYNGIERQLLLAKNPVYLSSFGYRGTFSYSYFFTGDPTRYRNAVHGDHIIYLFHDHDHLYGPPDYKYSDNDWIMVDTIVQLWTSFAISGTPTTAGLNSTAIWEPYSSRHNYLQIGNGSDVILEMKDQFLEQRMEFWDRLTAVTSWK